jgi:hypothetical protein
MGRSTTSGPLAGALQTGGAHTPALALSTADQLLMAFEFPADGRATAVIVRTLNAGTGTLTAHKVRRAAAGNTLVTVAGTQMLSADGGAIAANAKNSILPSGSTPTLLAAQRNFTKGQQIGVFGSTDGGTANRASVEIVWHPTDHAVASEADD